MGLDIGEAWPAWHALARRASWRQQGDPLEVLVFLSAKPVADVEALRTQAADALSLRLPGVLPLLGVEPVGEGVGWIYPDRRLVSLGFFTQPVLGHRAAAEVLAAVARVVEQQGHPGPNVEDVLLDENGEVLLANFAGPLTPVARAPNLGDEESRAVYRLGALLAQMLAGAIWPGSTSAAHDAAVRRVLIRAMSTPGAVFSDRYADWMRAMLAWDPVDRPPLSRIAEGFEELASTSRGLPLAAVTRRDFGAWMQRARHFQTPESALSPISATDDREYAGRTTLAHERVIGEIEEDDDPTVESTIHDPVDHTPPSVLERGTIPVEVGPPAAALLRPPTLPPGFLDPQAGDTLPSLSPRSNLPKLSPIHQPGWVLPLAALLTSFALLLAWWLWLA